MASNDFLNDNEDVVFIGKYLSEKYGKTYDENDIGYVVDLIYEYYEKSGMFTDCDDEEILINEDEVAEFVLHCLKEDGMNHITEEAVGRIIEGEFEYCKSIGVFDEE